MPSLMGGFQELSLLLLQLTSADFKNIYGFESQVATGGGFLDSYGPHIRLERVKQKLYMYFI